MVFDGDGSPPLTDSRPGSPENNMGFESRKEGYDSFRMTKNDKDKDKPLKSARRDTMDEPDFADEVPVHLGE